ncbi:MAG: class I SAM-dependent methyltransferase [Anaerolineaceae bacterium]|nr:class I SAM-dependent methyltransferase [Anaerolineaceae bacterium]
MDNNYKWYPAPRYLLRKQLLLKLLKQTNYKNKEILEIGYGSGDNLSTFANLGMNVFGYDFSLSAYEEAKTRLAKQGLFPSKIKIFTEEQDAYSRHYDIVVACEVLEHIKEDKSMLCKWNTLLRNDGFIILSVPSRMKKWCDNDVWAGHYRRYEKEDLKNELSDAGFVVNKFWSYPFPANFFLDPLLNMNKKQDISNYQTNNITKEDASKLSGVRRKTGFLARKISNKWVLYPLHLLQLFFLNTDLGSGYIVLCKKQ